MIDPVEALREMRNFFARQDVCKSKGADRLWSLANSALNGRDWPDFLPPSADYDAVLSALMREKDRADKAEDKLKKAGLS